MKILVGNEIQRAVVACKPLKIAVAYIGTDWETFISDVSFLEAIIVSPTFGSNPDAIKSLVNKIGWEKVLFLDELHAKTYIGQKSAVIGSANLTRNGLGAEGLVELCVEVNADENLKKVNKAFDDLKQRALGKYPTTESKKSRLKVLEMSWGAAIANQIVLGESGNSRSFVDFELLGNDHFYVLWYQPVYCTYSADVEKIESLIADDIHFAKEDSPEMNKWALLWRITNSSKAHKTVKPYWLYIHQVFEGGVIDKGYQYPKCAIQRRDLKVPIPPFELTGDVVTAFNKAVQEKNIAKYLIQNEKDVFSLAYSMKGVPLLIDKMKEYMANKANAADAKRWRG